MVGVTIPVVLELPDVLVIGVEPCSDGTYRIAVQSTAEAPCCDRCGRRCSPHGHDEEIQLRHLAILGKPCILELRPRRFICLNCAGTPTSTERLIWHQQRSPHTRAYDEYLVRSVLHSTVADTVRKEGLGEGAVLGALRRVLPQQVNWTRFSSLDTLGIDEIALRKGHASFVTLVTCKTADGQVHLLGVLDGREKSTVLAFFASIPEALRHTVQHVCSDLYEGYLQAAREAFPWSKVTADRFHVSKLFRAGVDTVRKQEMPRLKKELSDEQYKELRGTYWSLRKPPEALTPEEAKGLKKLFDYSPALHTAYQLAASLTDIFDCDLDKEIAIALLRQWQQAARDASVRSFDRFVNTLDKHMDEIANYFVAFKNSGFVEGINNKVKTLKRRCYGLFRLDHLFQRIFLDLEGYAFLGV